MVCQFAFGAMEFISSQAGIAAEHLAWLRTNFQWAGMSLETLTASSYLLCFPRHLFPP